MLLGRLPDPDLVVFYDGVNGAAVMYQIIEHGCRADQPWAMEAPMG